MIYYSMPIEFDRSPDLISITIFGKCEVCKYIGSFTVWQDLTQGKIIDAQISAKSELLSQHNPNCIGEMRFYSK